MDHLRKLIKRTEIVEAGCPGCLFDPESPSPFDNVVHQNSSLKNLQEGRATGCEHCQIILDGIKEYDSEWESNYSNVERVKIAWKTWHSRLEGIEVFLIWNQWHPSFRIYDAKGQRAYFKLIYKKLAYLTDTE